MIALLDATLRVSAILLIALGLAWLLGKRTASLRHAVLVTALLCAAIVPLLGAVMPQWAARVIAVPQVLQTLSVPDRPPAPDLALSESTADIATLVRGTPASATEPAAPAVITNAPERSRNWRSLLPRVIEVTRILYLAGLAVSLTMLGLGLLQLRWIAARSAPMGGDYWQWQASEIADAYRLRRPVHLARSPHPSMLAIWGIVRPQVLLPAGAEDWPEERIRAVLLHELAHIRRNDWIIQVFAGLLRAIYWFNPLLWIACARLRQESEQACDDEVLGKGVNGADYAAHLLALARSLTRPARLLAPAPSMAHHSTLRKRIADILNPTVSRARASRWSVVKSAVALLAVTWMVAACRVAPPSVHTSDLPSPSSAADIVRTVQSPTAKTRAPAESTDAPVDTAGRRNGWLPETRRSFSPAPGAETRAPQTVAAGILELVDVALADDTPVPLSQFDWLARTLGTVQRLSRTVRDDDGRNPASLPENSTALLNALGNAANAAHGVASRNNRPRVSAPRLEQLAADLRAKAAELADAVLPLSDGKSAEAAGPALPLATSARDIARGTLADTEFVSPRLHNWLTEELGTLQRAAQSLISDDGRSPQASTIRLYALRNSLRTASRNAFDIADRADESEETRTKARNLAVSLRDLAARFDGLMIPVLSMAAAPAREEPELTEIQAINCTTDGQTGPEPASPNRPYKSLGIEPRAQAKLLYYQGSGLGVLAPRGWYCLALSGSSGTSLYVTPRQLSAGELLGGDSRGIAGAAIQLSLNIGDTSGRFAAARYIARLFPQARSFVDAVIAEQLEPASSFPSDPYPNDQLTRRTRRSSSIVEYLTPEGAIGLGYDSRLAPGEGPVSGVVMLLGEDHSVLKLSVRMPPELRDLAPAISRQVETDNARR